MKVILVLDEMPQNCAYCPCFYDEIDKCQVTWFKGYDEKGRPGWCPLKEMPERKRLPHETDGDDILFGKACGWNDCIEEIER